MRIIILSTGRGLRSESIEELRNNLGLQGSDELSLVTWRRSFHPLPVSRHLVLGPHPRLGRDAAIDQRVQGHDANPVMMANDSSANETPAKGLAAVGEAVTPERSVNTTAHLAVVHPRRVRQALLWRARRLSRAVARGTRVSLRSLIKGNLLYRKVRPRGKLGTSVGFAAGCLRAQMIHDLARHADLVVALDNASQRGAWTLAQRVPGPDVVVGVPAAKRLVGKRSR